jgi:hypothetical protein
MRVFQKSAKSLTRFGLTRIKIRKAITMSEDKPVRNKFVPDK